jgi:hypothetical protein
MDAMFGADCQDGEGCLENVCQGRFGMEIVTKYLLIAIDQAGIQAFHTPMMLNVTILTGKTPDSAVMTTRAGKYH